MNRFIFSVFLILSSSPCLADQSVTQIQKVMMPSGPFAAEAQFGFSPYTSYLARTGPSYPSMNFSGGIRVRYAVSHTLGFFLGLDRQTRNYELSSGKVGGPPFYDIPFGIEFRHQGAFGFNSALNTLKLGAFVAFPGGKLLDYGDIVAAEAKTTGGALLEASALFPVVNQFYIGPGFGVKYGIRNPFEATFSYPSVGRTISYLDIRLGLSAVYLF